MSLPASLQELVEQLKKLPGVGAKSAQRLAFHILRTPREDTDKLCQAIRDVKDRVTYCSTCNNITDVDPCGFCSADNRDRHIICVVEEPQNVEGEALRALRADAGKPLQLLNQSNQRIRQHARVQGS